MVYEIFLLYFFTFEILTQNFFVDKDSKWISGLRAHALAMKGIFTGSALDKILHFRIGKKTNRIIFTIRLKIAQNSDKCTIGNGMMFLAPLKMDLYVNDSKSVNECSFLFLVFGLSLSINELNRNETNCKQTKRNEPKLKKATETLFYTCTYIL